jgi:hypothetical protein
MNASGVFSRRYEAAERCVAENPTSAVGVAFGVGLGIGLCVGLAMKSAMYDRRHAHQRLTERLGRQVLDALSSVLPESLTRAAR